MKWYLKFWFKKVTILPLNILSFSFSYAYKFRLAAYIKYTFLLHLGIFLLLIVFVTVFSLTKDIDSLHPSVSLIL